MATTEIVSNPELGKAVEEGLTKHPKSLPSWLLYDAEGDRIFQQIMRLDEYYPTRSEIEILENHKEDLLRYFNGRSRCFNLVEFGAGDGRKTEILLMHFHMNHVKFAYVPIDISNAVLNQLTKRLQKTLPSLVVEPVVSEYFEALQNLKTEDRKVILFMGASIGNFTPDQARNFLIQLHHQINPNDYAFIGFDLKKEPKTILNAYNDKHGITRDFNLNLLKRLNRELGANFNVDQFQHVPAYDPETGAAKSYLMSLSDQNVRIEALEASFHFSQWETIYTEISQKYDLLSMERLLSSSGLEIVDLFFDNNHYFCNVLVKKNASFEG